MWYLINLFSECRNYESLGKYINNILILMKGNFYRSKMKLKQIAQDEEYNLSNTVE